MYKPKLKIPPPPEFAVLDLDSLIFKAAHAGESVIYTGVCPEGKRYKPCKSAAEYKNWLDEVEVFGDMEYGYEGDGSDLERIKEIEVLDVKHCYKAFDRLLKEWVSLSGCKDWIGYVSKNSGMKNFRYDISTIKPYKGSRSGDKPFHLEAVRKYASKHPNVKISRGNVEVDDVTCAIAQRKGRKACVISVDKDARGVSGTHVFIPDEMDKPEYSSAKIVGRLYENEKGKVVGLGTLFWLYQCVAGDSVDAVVGCQGVGSKGAYNLLKDFDGVCVTHLSDALTVVCEAFKGSYGSSHQYTCAITEKPVEAHWKDIAIEMSRLVYMKKNQKDECFWIDMIREYSE